MKKIRTITLIGMLILINISFAYEGMEVEREVNTSEEIINSTRYVNTFTTEYYTPEKYEPSSYYIPDEINYSKYDTSNLSNYYPLHVPNYTPPTYSYVNLKVFILLLFIALLITTIILVIKYE